MTDDRIPITREGYDKLKAELDRLRHGVPRAERLDAWVMHPALIRTVGVSSDREDDDRGEPVAR